MNTPFEGNLSLYPFSQICHALKKASASGILFIEHRGTLFQIAWNDGRVYGAWQEGRPLSHTQTGDEVIVKVSALLDGKFIFNPFGKIALSSPQKAIQKPLEILIRQGSEKKEELSMSDNNNSRAQDENVHFFTKKINNPVMDQQWHDEINSMAFKKEDQD